MDEFILLDLGWIWGFRLLSFLKSGFSSAQAEKWMRLDERRYFIGCAKLVPASIFALSVAAFIISTCASANK